MTVRNNAELEKALMQKLKSAMQKGADRVLLDMHNELTDYYLTSTPEMYERTGAMGNTPDTTDVAVNGNTVSFKAYYDDSGSYSTGKKPTMLDVLNLADKGITGSSVGALRPAVGPQGFVERADDKIKDTMDDVLRQTFN